MVANMWKNSLKNVEADNNKIIYETLLEFYSETVLTFWISLVDLLHSTKGNKYVDQVNNRQNGLCFEDKLKK